MAEHQEPAPAGAGTAQAAGDAMPEDALKPGQELLNNYIVQEPIGQGGMAVVYRTLQKSLKRMVAVKVLHDRFADDAEFVIRFERESGALAALNHPNIVAIIDRGHDGRRYFFVMELVDGETLDQKIIDDKLTMADWRDVIQACRDSLEYVHKRGVIHLDIKPSNILIDREKRIKLSDFGISHIVGGDGGVELEARAMGTSWYMAPEQVATPEDVDARADIYALAVTFYKMMARAIPGDSVVPPSEANENIPVAVDAVIFRGMAPDREDRYQTVRDFCDDLLKALKDSSKSLASILDYRGRESSSALYTGADFITPKPLSRTSGDALPKIAATPKSEDRTTPNPKGRAKSESKQIKLERKEDTPPTISATSHEDVAPPTARPEVELAKSPRLVKQLLLLVGLMIAVLLSILAVMMASKPEVQQSGEIKPITDTESPAVARERALEEARRRERERIMGTQGASEPTPAPEASAP